jgi:soluble lytic murein transglycosylase-like protein
MATLERSAFENDIPSDYLTRLIWQESRFNAYSVSRAGALGIAQFMPETARSRGLTDPFDPQQAIVKSAELLRDLTQQFGNLGLAAAAYNAGPKRMQDFIARARGLPLETRSYVRIITGHPVEYWADPQQGKATKRDEVGPERSLVMNPVPPWCHN